MKGTCPSGEGTCPKCQKAGPFERTCIGWLGDEDPNWSICSCGHRWRPPVLGAYGHVANRLDRKPGPLLVKGKIRLGRRGEPGIPQWAVDIIARVTMEQWDAAIEHEKRRPPRPWERR
jgi:hypothetical protein